MNTIRTSAVRRPIFPNAIFSGMLSLAAASAAAAADVYSLVELPNPDFIGVAGVSNLAADGTAIGTGYPDGMVVRWRPGQAPENLGGSSYTLDNVMPLISADGSVIVAGSFFPNPSDPDGVPDASAGIWRGGTTWERISGEVLERSTPYAISDDGRYIAGAGVYTSNPPPGEVAYQYPWTWSATGGQVVLPRLPGWNNAEVWAISNDGGVAAGFAHNAPDEFVRYGLIWSEGGARQLFDAQSQPVGQAIGCNSTCSIVVGAGFTGSGGSRQAWRWTAQNGVQHLGEVPGAPPDSTYYAFDTTEDGATIVGSYGTIDPVLGFVNRGFVWTAGGGMVDLVALLAQHGIDYGADFNDLVINSITRDGRRMLINAADSEYFRRRAIVRLDPDALFADGFEPPAP